MFSLPMRFHGDWCVFFLKFRRTMAFALLAFFVVSCASGGQHQQSHDRYLGIINTWIGHNVDELVSKWGYPQQSFLAPNSNKVWVYHRQTVTSQPQIAMPVGSFMVTEPAKSEVHFCTTYFETNHQGVIVRTSFKGNACK